MDNKQQQVMKQIEEAKKKQFSIKVSEQVFNTIQNYNSTGQLALPKGYNVGNALMSACLEIAQNQKLSECTPISINQALIHMVVSGLNPDKKQCYFIPYDGNCTFTPSYFGEQVAVKRVKGVIDVVSDVIYKDTQYELEVNGYGLETIKVIKPCPLETRNKGTVVGAWCKIILDKEVWGVDSYTMIMTIEDIKTSWAMSRNRNNNQLQNQFTTEACKRTVIRKCIKNWKNTNEYEDVILDSLFNDEDEYEELDQVKKDSIDAEFEVKKEQAKKEVKVEQPKQQVQPTVEVDDEGF